jgi:acyl-CoA thioesterase
MAAQASIVFLDKVREGETLIAEAQEVAREGRAGVTRVAVRTVDGRAVAEFTGYSRTLGGQIVEI